MRLNVEISRDTGEIVKEFNDRQIPTTKLVHDAVGSYNYLIKQEYAGHRIVILDPTTNRVLEEVRLNE